MSSSVTFLMRKSWNHFVNLKGWNKPFFQGKPGRDNVKHWQRPTPEPHGRMPAAQIPCNDIKPDDPVWYHLDRFSKKIMISTTVLNLDITNYGPKNADGFTSMIFTSPVPSPKQQEHFYMCSPNASTFEEAIHLEECNPCEIPGFVLQLDLDFLLDLAKKKTAQFSWYDIYIYSTTKNIGAFVPIFIFLCLPLYYLGKLCPIWLLPLCLTSRGWRRRMDCQGHQVWLGILG